MKTHTIEAQADDRKNGMTIDEIVQFVNAATQAGIPGDSPIRVTTGWANQIQKIAVSGISVNTGPTATDTDRHIIANIHDPIHYVE